MLRNVEIRFWKDRSEFMRFGLILFSFIACFLCFYRPFFLQDIHFTKLLLYAIVVALFTLTFSLLNFNFAKHYLKGFTRQWSVSKEVAWTMYHFVFIGLLNTLLTKQLLNSIHLEWYQMIFYTTLVGTPPVFLDVFLRSKNRVKRDKKTESKILYVKSDGNYLEIYLGKEGSLERKIIRSSLSEMAKQEGLVQVHRSYLVNWERVISVRGNSNGGELMLNSTDQKVPYSRTYYPVLPEL